MERKNIVTAPQLFSLFFLCNIIIGITYNLPMAKSSSVLDHILSAIAALLINILLIFPIYKIYKINPNINIVDNCIKNFKKIGILFLIIYGVYYIFVCCYMLSLFNIFVRDIVDPDISLFMLTFCVILGSSYAACKGIEGIARACSIILFIICLAIAFIIFIIIPQIDFMNYTPLLFSGPNDFINGIFYLTSLSFYIPLAATLLPVVKSGAKKVLIATNAVTYILFAIVIIIIAGALGDYLKTQSFPIYEATSTAEIGVFKRLDAIYLGIFTSGLFITVSLFLFAFFLVIKKILGVKRNKLIIFFADIFLLVISLILPEFEDISCFFYDTKFIFVFTFLTSFVIPTTILLKYKLNLKWRND